MIRALVAIWVMCPVAATALTLELPASATLQLEQITPDSSYDVPVGSWAFDGLPTLGAEGVVARQVWRIEEAGLTTLQLLSPLREQIMSEGYHLLYECRTDACGGFDFRFGTEVAPPPEMQVYLGDFRYLAARRETTGGEEFITLFVSRTERAGFLQVTYITPENTPSTPTVVISAPAPETGDATRSTGFGDRLEANGHVVLADLKFTTGSADLGPGPFTSLGQLAAYLGANPNRKVALVGHTDSAGSLEANIALSRQRAISVLDRLVSDYGTARQQLDAQGMGYLAPISTNLTPEGREANRRVEVILTSTN